MLSSRQTLRFQRLGCLTLSLRSLDHAVLSLYGLPGCLSEAWKPAARCWQKLHAFDREVPGSVDSHGRLWIHPADNDFQNRPPEVLDIEEHEEPFLTSLIALVQMDFITCGSLR